MRVCQFRHTRKVQKRRETTKMQPRKQVTYPTKCANLCKGVQPICWTKLDVQHFKPGQNRGTRSRRSPPPLLPQVPVLNQVAARCHSSRGRSTSRTLARIYATGCPYGSVSIPADQSRDDNQRLTRRRQARRSGKMALSQIAGTGTYSKVEFIGSPLRTRLPAAWIHWGGVLCGVVSEEERR